MRVKEFIGNEWVAYADYDNRRSLPHVMDGLKITQRKALYTASTLSKDAKPMKVDRFSAKAAELTAYHHGDTSMISTVVKLAQDFPGSNNYPLLQKRGQFGSRLSKTASAPRYIEVSAHDNWNKLFLDSDQEIVEFLYDEGERIEPKFFIPVVPTLLLNGCDGVGNGFKSLILNYALEDVIRALKEIKQHGKVKTPLTPHINGWNGTITKIDRQVVFTGSFKKVNSTKIEITEIPPQYDNEKYKKLLNTLIDEKLIKDYQNESTENQWKWVLECPRTTTSLSDDELIKKFGLVTKATENIVCWGEDDRAPITFATVENLIEYWYEFRLKLYSKSKLHQISKLKSKIISADLRGKFIEWCLENDFKKLTKQEFIERSSKDIKGLSNDDASKFVNTPMYKITKDEVQKMKDEIEKLFDMLDEVEASEPLDIMFDNIKKLKL